MITKQDFDQAGKSVLANFTALLPEIVDYKSFIQLRAISIATSQEIEDIHACQINQSMIDKLCRVARCKWQVAGDATSLYCAAMAVATIIKDFDWGTQYLTADGLWPIAQRIQNS